MTDAVAGANPRTSRRLGWAGLALGFGLGGFFDGILLHQVLQWHHLLSGVEQARQDIRVLILADGLFHVLMYLVTGVGLWLLWRARRELSDGGQDRRLLGYALVGFGAWHVVDAILSHWVLGIHRIRMDVDNPLVWDLLWLSVFGIVPLVVGLLMRRGGAGGRRLMSSPLALLVATGIAGPWAALPPPNQTEVVVLFRPGISEQQAVTSIAAAGGRMLGSDPSGQLWAVDMRTGGDSGALYRGGALLVSNALLPLGCFNWTRA